MFISIQIEENIQIYSHENQLKIGISMTNEVMKRELQEAITAGEQALESLKTAREKLNSAKSWGYSICLAEDFFHFQSRKFVG